MNEVKGREKVMMDAEKSDEQKNVKGASGCERLNYTGEPLVSK